MHCVSHFSISHSASHPLAPCCSTDCKHKFNQLKTNRKVCSALFFLFVEGSPFFLLLWDPNIIKGLWKEPSHVQCFLGAGDNVKEAALLSNACRLMQVGVRCGGKVGSGQRFYW